MAVEKADLDALKRDILREIAAGFKGVYQRQDRTNGNVLRLQDADITHVSQLAAHRAEIDNLKDAVFRKGKTALQAVTGVVRQADAVADRGAEALAVSRRDVAMFVAGIVAVVGALRVLGAI